jgi:hypothetical protein
MILPRTHYLNPYIYNDYKLKYYQLIESETWNIFLVIVVSIFMHPLHQRWLLHYMNFIRNHQPIKGIGNAMVSVCNIECAVPI